MSKNPLPLIGCTTYRKTIPQASSPLDIIGLMPSYINAVVAAGGVPILIPLGLSDAQLMAIFARIDGLLLPGGGDVDPTEYAGNPHDTMFGIDRDRDRVELLMARTAVAEQKPLLAICRGIQVLNVALGGSLYEDLRTHLPNALTHDNFENYPASHIAHEVTIHSGTKLAQQIGQTHTHVNSLHHQGINRLADNLVAAATAPDGLIEAVELPNHPYALGVQWHPEHLVQNDPTMLSLFKGLVTAATNPS